jgi:hypothetical protein
MKDEGWRFAVEVETEIFKLCERGLPKGKAELRSALHGASRAYLAEKKH